MWFTLPPQRSLLVFWLFSAIPIPCLKILFFIVLVLSSMISMLTKQKRKHPSKSASSTILEVLWHVKAILSHMISICSQFLYDNWKCWALTYLNTSKMADLFDHCFFGFVSINIWLQHAGWYLPTLSDSCFFSLFFVIYIPLVWNYFLPYLRKW